MNSNLRSQLKQSELDALLKRERQNLNSYIFRAADAYWKLDNSSARVNVTGAVQAFDKKVQPYFRLALATYAEQRAAGTVLVIVDALRRWTRSFPIANPLSEQDFLAYAAHLGRSAENEASRIRGFYRFWYDVGYAGVTSDFLSEIKDRRFYGGDKFVSVMTMDPHKGPYTPIESQAILDHLHNALSSDLISESDFFLVYLVYLTGSRLAQILQLNFSDFIIRNGKYLVKMPRAKQQGMPFRGAFSELNANEDLFIALELHKRRVLQQLDLNNSALQPHLPVFPNFQKFLERSVTSLEHITQDHYADRFSLRYRVESTGDRIGAHSERTGEIIHLAPKRLRSTIGTDMARAGYGKAPIAAQLDHTDLQHVDHYVQSQPEFAAVIDRAVGSMLAPLAQAFQGMVIREESEATRCNDSTSRIRTEDGTNNIGNCGSFGFCGANAPVSCYTCIRFQPWRDAPHQEVADGLIAERDHVLDVTGDETIARQLDRSILAVVNVIHQCEAMKKIS